MCSGNRSVPRLHQVRSRDPAQLNGGAYSRLRVSAAVSDSTIALTCRGDLGRHRSDRRLFGIPILQGPEPLRGGRAPGAMCPMAPC